MFVNLTHVWMKKMLLLDLVHGTFLALIMIQSGALILCFGVMVKRKILKDVYQFLNEYWSWDHLKQNILTISLWVSSFMAYLHTLFITTRMKDLSLLAGYNKHPYPIIYVWICLVGFIGYTVYRCIEQLDSTIDICNHIKKFRVYRFFKRSVKNIQFSWFNLDSWSAWISPVILFIEWFADHITKTIFNAKMRKVLLRFFVFAILEYLMRMSVVLVSIFIIMY